MATVENGAIMCDRLIDTSPIQSPSLSLSLSLRRMFNLTIWKVQLHDILYPIRHLLHMCKSYMYSIWYMSIYLCKHVYIFTVYKCLCICSCLFVVSVYSLCPWSLVRVDVITLRLWHGGVHYTLSTSHYLCARLKFSMALGQSSCT
jgi:hypothetical protein